MNRIAARSSILVLLAVALPGCGGGGGGITTPTPTPTPPPVTALILEDSFSGLGELTLAPVPFDTTATGTIEATVDWTFATDDVDIYLVRGSCTLDQFNNGTCSFVAFSESPTAKPETIRATNQAPGSFTLYIGNRGPAEESVSYQVFLTTGGSGASVQAKRVGAGRPRDFVRILPRR
jgi:hypothetical protein